MGLGGTAKKIQMLADKAEQMYEKLNQLRTEVQQTQETVNDTSERVQKLEVEMAEQRAVLDAVAREVGVELESVSTDAHIDEAENAAGDGPDGSADGTEGTASGQAEAAPGGEAKNPENAKTMGAGGTVDDEAE